MRSFGSDNHCGVHAELMKAIVEANIDHAPSYGTDIYSEKLNKVIQNLFGDEAVGYCVFNGTGANILALKAFHLSPGAVLCSDIAHINVDECAAPETIAGVKIWPLPNQQGKLKLESLERAFVRSGDQHFAQFKMLSLTQPTEYGTCYSLKEIRELTHWAHQHGLKVHMDGARIANALHYLQCSWRELVTESGIDVLSLGGTKNGFMMGEMVIFPRGTTDSSFPFLRKQCLQLPSKTRFIAAQFLTYFETGLYKTIASHAHQMARQLADAIEKNSQHCTLTQPVQSNAVFVKIPKKLTKALKAVRFFYIWDETTWECRLMTHHDTQESDIIAFRDALISAEKLL